MVTTLGLLILPCILSYCWKSTLQMDWEKHRWSKYREWKIYCCEYLLSLNLKFGNFMLSFGRLRQKIVLRSVPHVQHDYFSSFNKSDHCFLASSLPFSSSFSKLHNDCPLQHYVAALLPSTHLGTNISPNSTQYCTGCDKMTGGRTSRMLISLFL